MRPTGALLVVAFDPVCAGILRSPGEWGADVVVGEGQALGMPLSFGGPYLGLFACTASMSGAYRAGWWGRPSMPKGAGPMSQRLRAREQDIRREKATSNVCTNQTLMAVTAAIQLGWLGRSGLAEVALRSARAARYCRQALLELSRDRAPCRRARGPRVRRCAFPSTRRPSSTAWSMPASWPGSLSTSATRGGADDGLLVAVTERRTRAEIDAFVDAMDKAVR